MNAIDQANEIATAAYRRAIQAQTDAALHPAADCPLPPSTEWPGESEWR